MCGKKKTSSIRSCHFAAKKFTRNDFTCSNSRQILVLHFRSSLDIADDPNVEKIVKICKYCVLFSVY